MIMKNLLLFIILFPSISLCQTKEDVEKISDEIRSLFNDDCAISFIEKVNNKTSEQLFKASRYFMDSKSGDSNFKINNSIEANTVSFDSSFYSSVQSTNGLSMTFNYEYTFNVKISSKDNRYKVDLRNITLRMTTGVFGGASQHMRVCDYIETNNIAMMNQKGTRGVLYNTLYNFNKELSKYIDSIKNAMIGDNSSIDW